MAMRPGETIDPRSSLYRLRRKQLEAVLFDNQIPYPQDIPAEASRSMILHAGIDVERYLDPRTRQFLWPESWHVRPVPAPQAASEPVSEEPAPAQRETEKTPETKPETPSGPVHEEDEQPEPVSGGSVDLDQMKMQDLRRMAKSLGVSQSPKDNKEAVKAKIREKLGEQPA